MGKVMSTNKMRIQTLHALREQGYTVKAIMDNELLEAQYGEENL